MQTTKWELYEYQRSRSVIDLGPNHLHSIFLNFFSSITADFNTSSAIRWAIQDQWSSGFFYSSWFCSKFANILKFCLIPYQQSKKTFESQLPTLILRHYVFILFRKIYMTRADAQYKRNKPMPMYCWKIGKQNAILNLLKCVLYARPLTT